MNPIYIPVIVSCVAAAASLGGAWLIYRTSQETRAESRRKDARERAERAKAKSEDDTVTLRVKKLESAEDFQREILRLWESERVKADESAHRELKCQTELAAIKAEFDAFRKKLGEAVSSPSIPPPRTVL